METVIRIQILKQMLKKEERERDKPAPPGSFFFIKKKQRDGLVFTADAEHG